MHHVKTKGNIINEKHLYQINKFIPENLLKKIDMKVLMQCRIDIFTKRGGDTIQMEKPIPFLKDMGVEVTISTQCDMDVTDYDLVHLTGITRVHETYSQLKNAERFKKPVVLTPMYNSKEDYDFYIRYGNDSLAAKLYKIFPSYDLYQQIRTAHFCVANRDFRNAFMQLAVGYKKQQEYVLKNTTMLIPNSSMELSAINKELGYTGMANMIVFSGVEIEKDLLDISQDIFFNKYALRDFVMVMGRIEPLKNQVKLMEAMVGTDIHIVFLGGFTKEHPGYCNKFREMIEAHKHFHYLGFVEREILFSAMKNARVVAAPSWCEIVGFTALEGGLMGVNAVMTERGFGRPYFGDDVWYCNPNDIVSIRKAVLDAYSSPRNRNNFRERIFQEFTWEKASIALHAAYVKALAIHSKN
ncbi:MAG: glycosyltransferase [bacterium]|nr:glycosyltransferase [bacterium]